MSEIIIDGVNVAECTYSTIGIDKECYCEVDLYEDSTPVYTCKECNNCYFKQLQRAKAENEKLKESLKIAEELCRTLEKAKTNEHYQWFDRCCEINNECDKYKQALNKVKNYCMTKDEFIYCADSDFYAKRAKDILNIINEVLNEG